jgi:hypothetical protein
MIKKHISEIKKDVFFFCFLKKEMHFTIYIIIMKERKETKQVSSIKKKKENENSVYNNYEKEKIE